MALMLVLADDLTGAADCGVTCAGHGLETMLVFGDRGGESDAEALAVDANTRSLGADEAAAETGRLLRAHLRSEETLLYKKIDSTLRGNIGAELAATLAVRRALTRAGIQAGERIVAVLAPAFPATGRTTVNGRQLVDGMPIEESGLFASGELATGSDLALMVRLAGLQAALMELELVRGADETLRTAMKAAAQDADVLVCDAETEDDLRRIAEASMTLGRGTVWAGSGGLARHLPVAAGLARGTGSAKESRRVAGPVLFVVGSGAIVSQRQVEMLGNESDTIVMKIAAEALLGGEQSSRWAAAVVELEGALGSGRDVAVMPDPDVRIDSAMGPALSAGLGMLVQSVADRVGALVVTGGETARAVFEAWGVNRLRLIGEVESGLPYSVTEGWKRELPVLTKAGGFGGPQSLLRCRDFLRGSGD